MVWISAASRVSKRSEELVQKTVGWLINDWSIELAYHRTLTYFVRGSITVCLTSCLGFSCFACAELDRDLQVWPTPNQSNRRSADQCYFPLTYIFYLFNSAGMTVSTCFHIFVFINGPVLASFLIYFRSYRNNSVKKFEHKILLILSNQMCSV